MTHAPLRQMKYMVILSDSMATSNSADEINIQNLNVEESTTPKPEAAAGETKEKVAKPKKEKPKQEKPKQEKPKPQAAVVEAPAEELDFNRTPEEVEKALDQWTKKPAILNQPNPDEKMYAISSSLNSLFNPLI